MFRGLEYGSSAANFIVPFVSKMWTQLSRMFVSR